MSTAEEILSQLENQINVGDTDASSDPTQELLISYLNRAMRKIAIDLKPREMKSGPVDIATVADTNTVTFPSTLLQIHELYLHDDSGDYRKLIKKSIPTIISPTVVYQQYVGTPSYWESRGNLIYLDKYIGTTRSDGIRAYGVLKPTDIDIDDLSISIDFNEEYDDVIVHQAAIFFFLRDFDEKMLAITRNLYNEEKARLKVNFGTNIPSTQTLDTNYWRHRRI